MARTVKKRGFIQTLDGNSMAMKLIASIIRLEDLFILLDGKGRQISYAKLSEKEGKTEADADACIAEIAEADKKEPFVLLGDGNAIRCSAIEAIEQHDGRDYRGLIFRGEGDSILSFLPVSSADTREKVASALHDALESYEAGKFSQPNLTEILSTN
ncbi:MAG: hypothetical protein ACTS2B_19490 [Vibrio diabolicus]